MRSAYHIRELDVYRLLQIHRPLDIFLSHDWPRGIANFGNKAQLFRAKPFLQKEVKQTILKYIVITHLWTLTVLLLLSQWSAA